MRTLLVFPLLVTLAHAQKFTDIVIEPDTVGKNISYGSTVGFKFYTINKKNRQKEVNYRKVNDYIVCTATGAQWEAKEGRIVFPRHPADKGLVSAKLVFVSSDPEVHLNQTIEIKMNFRQPLSLDYKGQKGANGISGSDKGTPLLLRDGKPGDNGRDGADGGMGGSVTVRCKKEYDDFFKREILFLYVTDDSLHTEAIYRCPRPEQGIYINVCGGDGGNGGPGGDGGNGKDGVKTAEGERRPGNAGDGGNGGNGGNGGPGGRVTVMAHTNCSDILQYLRIENFGGRGGDPGRAGNAGKPGKPADGQNEAKNGNKGTMGRPGNPGANGRPFALTVGDF